jgi:hypothetical protein
MTDGEFLEVWLGGLFPGFSFFLYFFVSLFLSLFSVSYILCASVLIYQRVGMWEAICIFRFLRAERSEGWKTKST